MKQINPFTIWLNGQNKTAHYITLSAGSDNLIDSAQFYYALFDKSVDKDGKDIPGNQIVNGNITMTGVPYENWETNEQAWEWALQTLGLTLKTITLKP